MLPFSMEIGEKIGPIIEPDILEYIPDFGGETQSGVGTTQIQHQLRAAK